MLPSWLAMVVVLALGGCRTENPGGDDEPPTDGAPDAPGPGCFALSPRAIAPETFVGPTGLQPRLTALIDGAQTSLDIHMYLWTVRALADRVVAAKQRGVAVRVILDPDSPGNDAVRPTLTAGGVPIRDASVALLVLARQVHGDRRRAGRDHVERTSTSTR